MIAIAAPHHILAPLGAELDIPYRIEGAAKVSLDFVDPRQMWVDVPSVGFIHATAVSDLLLFRLEALDHEGHRQRHTVSVEAWEKAWFSVDGTDYAGLLPGCVALPRVLQRIHDPFPTITVVEDGVP